MRCRKNLALAILFIDRENNLLPHASEAATALLRCRDLRSGNIATLLRPLVAEKTLHSILATRDRLRQPAPADAPSGAAELANVDLRLPNPDGTVTTACCRFTFSAVDAHPDRDVCMVAIADETADVQHLRELVDMRKPGADSDPKYCAACCRPAAPASRRPCNGSTRP